MSRILLSCAAACVAMAMLTACSSDVQALHDARDQSYTAVASVRVAARLFADGSLPSTSASTSIVDALAELDEAQMSVTELEPSAVDIVLRAGTLADIRDAQDAVLAVQEALTSGEDLDAARGAVDVAARGLVR